MTEIYRQEPIGRPMNDGGALHNASLEASEQAAFERGRMQGELEAIRRLEAEQTQLKTFPANDTTMGAGAANLARPDVVEINRLTWPQRLAAALAEGTAIAYVIMTIVWCREYRGGFGWSTGTGQGDNYGNVRMWNTHLLTMSLGLFSLTQALLMYRMLPLNTNPWLNRGIYLFWQACAITCFIISIVGSSESQPDATWWGAESWCFGLALCVALSHSVYSMIRVMMEAVRPVDYETWSETNTKVTVGSPEQRRDHSLGHAGQVGRTVYAPAPRFGMNGSHLASGTNTHVPNAPANAPRWAENPNTHSEDYFLVPRKKWAVVGYVALGAAMLMTIAVVQHVLAAGRENWAQYIPREGLYEVGNEAHLLSALGVITLASVVFTAYAAMPPRTTIVKNGILVDHNANRRASISHNAETRIGPNAV